MSKQQEPIYKAGEKVRITGNLFDNAGRTGKVVTLLPQFDGDWRYGVEDGIKPLGFYYATELEPLLDEPSEPVNINEMELLTTIEKVLIDAGVSSLRCPICGAKAKEEDHFIVEPVQHAAGCVAGAMWDLLHTNTEPEGQLGEFVKEIPTDASLAEMDERMTVMQQEQLRIYARKLLASKESWSSRIEALQAEICAIASSREDEGKSTKWLDTANDALELAVIALGKSASQYGVRQ